MATHIVIGNGTAPEEAVAEALKDALSDGDRLVVEWVGQPMSEAMDAVYTHILNAKITSGLFYSEGDTVPDLLRWADNITVAKTQDPRAQLLGQVDGNVLLLWDDEEAPELLKFIWDNIPDQPVLDLSNGLTPITSVAEEPALAPPVEEEEDDTVFTRDELLNAQAIVVKRYGERLGCVAKTKSGIIEELFPEADAPAPAPAPVEEMPEIAIAPETPAPAPVNDPADIDAIVEFIKLGYWEGDMPSKDWDKHAEDIWKSQMARTKIEEAALWAKWALRAYREDARHNSDNPQ
jgi:hypothetical protein